MLYTIGHSNHSLERFIELVQQYDIGTLIDVRSAPYSKYSPHFTKEMLEESLKKHGIRYVFMGRELGGRPQNKNLYDERGHALYDRFIEHSFFQNGIARLQQFLDSGQNLVLLCSEEDPSICHRRLLIAWYLHKKHGIEVCHIRCTGQIEFESELQKSETPSLFDDEPAFTVRRSAKKIAG